MGFADLTCSSEYDNEHTYFFWIQHKPLKTKTLYASKNHAWQITARFQEKEIN